MKSILSLILSTIYYLYVYGNVVLTAKVDNPLHDCIFAVMISFCFLSNFSVFRLILFDTLSYKIENLTVDRTAFVLSDILDFPVNGRVNFDTEMLIFLVPHSTAPQKS